MSQPRKAIEHRPDRPSRSAEQHVRTVMLYIQEGLLRFRIRALSSLQAELVLQVVREQLELVLRGRKGKRIPEPREKKKDSFHMKNFETALLHLYGEKQTSKVSLLKVTNALVSVGITDDTALLAFYKTFMSALPQGFSPRFGTIDHRVFQNSKKRYRENTQKPFPEGIGINIMKLLGEYLIVRGLLNEEKRWWIKRQ